jgi:hypothetical protein
MRLHIPEEWVCKQGKHRYVFADAIFQKAYEVSHKCAKSRKVYDRFYQALGRGLYNQTTLYGLRAIDIDQPQKPDLAVSVRLEFIIGEGTDSYEQTWVS